MTENNLSTGWWYYKVTSPPTYTICFVMRNQFSKEGEWMIWFTDHEGAYDLTDLNIENFIKKVPEPF